jgi:hypothetical protein
MNDVTIVMPYKDTPEWLALSSKMWLAQEGNPLLIVIDTGSTVPGAREAVEEVGQHPRAEVVYLNPKWPLPHPWDLISTAHDYGLSRCQTEFIMTTHTDVFPKHRGVVSYMRNLCGKDAPIVGWEMSKRGDNLKELTGPWVSDGFMGMACTIMHVPMLDRVGAGWSIRRAHNSFGTARTNVGYGWPDNETCMGNVLKRAGVKFTFLGRETNFVNQETDHWLHARSMTLRTVTNKGLEPRHNEALVQMRALYESWLEIDSKPINNNLS